MNQNPVIRMLFPLIIFLISGCTTLSQGPDELIIRDPENGSRVVSTNKISTVDEKNQLGDLWVYASFSADVYLPINDSNRLIQTDGVWDLYCTNKETANRAAICEYKNAGEEGMEYEVWRNKARDTAVISFRGTDFEEPDDWISNLRWFIPSNEDDQYDAVGAITLKIAEDLQEEHGGIKIITTGHSLGGGLAQRAAYSSEGIQLVYAFDPSMVTGFFDVFSVFDFLSYNSKKEIDIYRVFEHGEVMAYPRWFMKLMFPISNSNPRISELRFNYVKGNVVAQHSMIKFAKKLKENYEVVALN